MISKRLNCLKDIDALYQLVNVSDFHWFLFTAQQKKEKVNVYPGLKKDDEEQSDEADMQ
jgi:hypothetical protein